MRLAYAALLPFLAGTMFLCNPVRAEIRSAGTDMTFAAPDSTDTAVPYAQIETKPTFQGGDANTFSKWVSQHLQYPKEAKDDGIQGRVMVRFTICDDGVVRNAKVLRGVHPLLDAEALRVISSSPKWEPGTQGGKPLNVTFMFPVIFKVYDDDPPVQTIQIRGNAGADPLIYLDGEKFTGNISEIDPSTIKSMEVLKDQAAIEKYGEEAKNGVILITSKKN